MKCKSKYIVHLNTRIKNTERGSQKIGLLLNHYLNHIKYFLVSYTVKYSRRNGEEVCKYEDKIM
jgi:hypothetical protein